jgi:hypothetical protein
MVVRVYLSAFLPCAVDFPMALRLVLFWSGNIFIHSEASMGQPVSWDSSDNFMLHNANV